MPDRIRHGPALATLAAALFLAAPAAAQERPTQPTPQAQQGQQPPPGQPGVIVVSYNKCGMGTMAEFAQWRMANWTPLADRAVQEGRLLGYGELEHGWGDEWNFVLYYTAKDVASFHAAFQQLMGDVMKREPQPMAAFGRFCTEHKDNIYTVSHIAPPAPAPARRP